MTTVIDQPTALRIAQLKLSHSAPKATPEWWDRDCRCCLELPQSLEIEYRKRTGRTSYATKGGDQIIVLGNAEEVHADHNLDELAHYIGSYAYARSLER